MAQLRLLLDLILRFLKGIAYDWLVALIDVIRGLIELIKRLCRPELPHSQTNATNTGCASVDNPAFHRPDPCIYSQKYLLSLGLAVTWDNPDIPSSRTASKFPKATCSRIRIRDPGNHLEQLLRCADRGPARQLFRSCPSV